MTSTETLSPPHPEAPEPPGGPLKRFLRLLHTYPRRALVGVFLFIVVAGAVGGPVAGALEAEGGFTPADAESVRATERIEQATGLEASPSILMLIEDVASPDDPAVTAAVATLSDIDGIAQASPAGVAEDGSSVLVIGVLEAQASDPEVGADVIEAFDGQDRIVLGGGAVMGVQLGEQIGEDLARAEMFAFPILVVLALLFFGGRAAVLPVTVGVATVLGTFLGLAGVNQLYGISVFALNLVIGLGLGLAVDYTLFLVTRYREELERQGPTFGAVVTTLRTAGRTVVYSAATVAVALATLTVFPMSFLTSMGLAGVVVTLVAAVSALVICPILFGLWGTKLQRRRTGDAAEGRWYRFSHLIMRRPGVFAVATTIVMIALAAPALRTEWTPVDSTVIPPGQSARVVTDALERDYADTGTTPVTAVVGSSDAGTDAVDLAAQASGLDGVVAQAEAVDLGSGTWQIDLEVAGDPASEEARAVVEQVREIAAAAQIDALVTGPAAEFIDQQEAITDTLPLAAFLIIALTMLVLWLMTGSVVLPVKAVIMNLLTVGVALGAITWVYQDGRFADFLGYTPNGGVEPTNFLIAAAVVFALSTDYGVFLLGRVKEARDAGVSERESVALGLGRTGSVVTAAAILLAVAIGAFSMSEISFIQQIGIAAAVGVLVDAFIVRSLLVPALMGLMGKWNWWAPMWLRRVHDRIGLSEGESVPIEASVREPADAETAPVGR